MPPVGVPAAAGAGVLRGARLSHRLPDALQGSHGRLLALLSAGRIRGVQARDELVGRVPWAPYRPSSQDITIAA